MAISGTPASVLALPPLAEASQEYTLLSSPTELIEAIIGYADLNSIFALAVTCRHLYQIVIMALDRKATAELRSFTIAAPLLRKKTIQESNLAALAAFRKLLDPVKAPLLLRNYFPGETRAEVIHPLMALPTPQLKRPLAAVWTHFLAQRNAIVERLSSLSR